MVGKIIREDDMLSNEIIIQRLNGMTSKRDPSTKMWPENCAGSRKALVIFLGPSPGGDKEEPRRKMNLEYIRPLWNESYEEPLHWSRGFQVSFKGIVEALFGMDYGEASKLIARINLDWMPNPESQDVAYHFMWEGFKRIFPVIMECEPELIIPMDEKTFGVLQIGFCEYGYDIIFPKVGEIKIKISEKNGEVRYHQDLLAFIAKSGRNSIMVIKSWQHPARIYDSAYAKRIGEGIRLAAKQMEMDRMMNITI
jgi:hypothetical protein